MPYDESLQSQDSNCWPQAQKSKNHTGERETDRVPCWWTSKWFRVCAGGFFITPSFHYFYSLHPFLLSPLCLPPAIFSSSFPFFFLSLSCRLILLPGLWQWPSNWFPWFFFFFFFGCMVCAQHCSQRYHFRTQVSSYPFSIEYLA